MENFCVTADSCGKLQEECPDCEIDIRGEMPFTLSAPNALRLGFWELTLPQGQRAVVETAPLIDQLETGKLCYPIVQRNYFGCPKEIDFSATTASFSHKFFVEEGAGAEEPVYLVMEPGTFLGKWSLAVNGTVLTEKDFTEKYIYEKHNLVTEVTSLLHTGENEITASVEVEVSFGGMRNPLYLFGSFGVEKRGDLWHLTEVKKEGSMENLPACGLPFYYGEVVYTTELTLPEDGELWKKEAFADFHGGRLADRFCPAGTGWKGNKALRMEALCIPGACRLGKARQKHSTDKGQKYSHCVYGQF